MKTAIISDVHGNYPALAAVIADAEAMGVERYIFAGDYIFDLPYSNEVTEFIKKLDNAYAVQGNKEGYLNSFAKQDQSKWTHEQFSAMYQTFRELKSENLEYLMNLPKSVTVPLLWGKQAYVTHFFKEFVGYKGSEFKRNMAEKPFSHEEFLILAGEKLSGEAARAAFDPVGADAVIVGHTHLQWFGYCNGKLIINPGSCGMPADFDARASYTILDDNGGELRAEERRVEYDIEEAIINLRDSAIYREGRIWGELVIRQLRDSNDLVSELFALAREIAAGKDEEGKNEGKFFSNETWREAAEILGLK